MGRSVSKIPVLFLPTNKCNLALKACFIKDGLYVCLVFKMIILKSISWKEHLVHYKIIRNYSSSIVNYKNSGFCCPEPLI